MKKNPRLPSWVPFGFLGCWIKQINVIVLGMLCKFLFLFISERDDNNAKLTLN